MYTYFYIPNQCYAYYVTKLQMQRKKPPSYPHVVFFKEIFSKKNLESRKMGLLHNKYQKNVNKHKLISSGAQTR